jgi:hypothetical protein
MQVTELFWEVPLSDLKRGFTYVEEAESYVCLACGERFEEGVVYPLDGTLYEAGKFARLHVDNAHGSMFEYLLSLDKKLTGLTDLQKRLLQLFHEGLSDNEIVTELEGGSSSTIRNHRFTLRERMKQAKVFLAIMELANERKNRQQRLITVHRTPTMLDQQFAITEQENDDILKTYFKEGPDGPLSEFPKKEKRKVVILRHLARQFEENRQYTEKEVNALLKARFPDYVTLRRYLIEYGFMDRLPDGSRYWIRR